jgi:hypothetical protein
MIPTLHTVIFIAFLQSFGKLLLCHDLIELLLEEVVDLEEL